MILFRSTHLALMVAKDEVISNLKEQIAAAAERELQIRRERDAFQERLVQHLTGAPLYAQSLVSPQVAPDEPEAPAEEERPAVIFGGRTRRQIVNAENLKNAAEHNRNEARRIAEQALAEIERKARETAKAVVDAEQAAEKNPVAEKVS